MQRKQIPFVVQKIEIQILVRAYDFDDKNKHFLSAFL